jgi:YrbI family 3-deoxy-D-manno-octulosonate 8-phosphate phosphatase
VSTEVNPVVSARCAKLRIACQQGCPDKLAHLKELWAAYGVTPDETCYLGNDVNDATALAAVGLPVVVADAHPDVTTLARMTTLARGGRGAVRELCDLIADARESTASRGQPVVLG